MLSIMRYAKFCLIIISLLLITCETSAQNGAWIKKAQLKMPVVGASAAVVNNKIYVLGGMTPFSNDATVNQVYDPVTGKCELKKDMLTGRSFHSTAVVDGIIYAIGGGYTAPTNAVEAYDPATDTWTAKKEMLSTRIGAKAAVVNGIIYNVGGNYNERNCEAYDPRANTWTKKKDMPDAGGALGVSVYNGMIYAVGGGFYAFSSFYGPFETNFAYDPATDTWTRKCNSYTKRFALNANILGGKIYAIGGAQGSSSILSNVEAYDPVNDTWARKPYMPFQRCFFTSVVLNGKIYVIGGTDNWLSPSADVWEYDPSFQTNIAAGNVSGTWTKAKSPYSINGEITVPNNSTLTIEPGTQVVFSGHYKFNVQGRLLAMGTAADIIRIIGENERDGWHGIRFINTPNSNDTSKLIYCSLKFGKANTGANTGWDRSGGALMIRGFDKVLVSDCSFENNITEGDMFSTGGPGVYISNASPVITKCSFTNNTGSSAGAIRCDSASNAVISKNRIWNNTGNYGAILCSGTEKNTPAINANIISYNKSYLGGGGIFVYRSAKPQITNNIIVRNQAPLGGGIYCQSNANPVLINNTIADNTATLGNNINCQKNSNPVIINTVLHQDPEITGNQVFIMDVESDPHFFYCSVEGGYEKFGGNGARSGYLGLYQNNIHGDAGLLTAPLNFYWLADNSPCIGSGVDSIKVSGITYKAPAFCIMGKPRPSPAGSKPDIGACEHSSALPAGKIIVGAQAGISQPKEFALYQNYPNPFNPSTVISYQLPVNSQVTLKIYDALGNELTTLVNEYKSAGIYEVSFSAENLSSGVYFCQIKAGSYIVSKKMILLR